MWKPSTTVYFLKKKRFYVWQCNVALISLHCIGQAPIRCLNLFSIVRVSHNKSKVKYLTKQISIYLSYTACRCEVLTVTAYVGSIKLGTFVSEVIIAASTKELCHHTLETVAAVTRCDLCEDVYVRSNWPSDSSGAGM